MEEMNKLMKDLQIAKNHFNNAIDEEYVDNAIANLINAEENLNNFFKKMKKTIDK